MLTLWSQHFSPAHSMNRHKFHHRQAIKLWYPPLVSVDSVTYIDQNGDPQTLVEGTDFQVDPESEPAIIQPLPNTLWPITMRGVKNAAQILYTAGYEVDSSERISGESTASNVTEPEVLTVTAPSPPKQVSSYTLDLTIPEELVLAIKQLVLHWYQNRDIIIATPGAGGQHQPLPQHINELLADYMQHDFSARYYPREVTLDDSADEPVTLASAKQFCRVTSTADDTFITTLIRAARRHLERQTWRSLVKKQYLQSLDHFPGHIWPGTAISLYGNEYY